MSALDAFAGRIGRLLSAGRAVVRHGLRLDTNPVPGSWSHVTKVDPENSKRVPIAFPRYLRHTDAISVGGSADVTDENTARTFELLAPLSTPAFHEPSGPTHVTPETLSASAFLAVPQVLNGDDEAFVGTFGAGVEAVRDGMAPDLIGRLSWVPGVGDRLAATLTDLLISNAVIEAYIVQNPDSAAARESGVTVEDVLDAADTRRRAMAAEYVLGAEILYLEYSGSYGGDEAVAALSAMDDALDWTRVWYGGGIDSREKANAILEAGADAIVVGDAFHRVAEEEAELAAAYLDDCVASGDIDASGDSGASDDVGASGDIGEFYRTGNGDVPGAAEWLDDACDLSETAAARYLSTIPSVDEPVVEARRCLAAGLIAHRTVASGDVRIGDDGRPRVDRTTLEAVERTICIEVDEPEALATRLISALAEEETADRPATKLAR